MTDIRKLTDEELFNHLSAVVNEVSDEDKWDAIIDEITRRLSLNTQVRVAIEAGCRPVLRFRQSVLDKPGLYYCIQTDGRFSELIVQPWKTKDEVLKCCKSLGLTAEFVEGEKDGK